MKYWRHECKKIYRSAALLVLLSFLILSIPGASDCRGQTSNPIVPQVEAAPPESQNESQPANQLSRPYSSLPSPDSGFPHNPKATSASKISPCRVELKSFASKARGKSTSYYAFIPVSTDGEKRFPTLFLLHGAYDDYTAWKKHAGNRICELASEYGIIIITPDGDPFGWYADSPGDKANQIETFFINELIPNIEKELPANGLRGITGLSMGGHGAFVLALRNPGTFVTVSSMSGILDITRHATQWQLARVFGPYNDGNQKVWQEHSSLNLISQHRGMLNSLPMLISVSVRDRLCLAENVQFHHDLEEMGIAHEYEESPGGHDWDYWLSQLPIHVNFQAHNLNKREASRDFQDMRKDMPDVRRPSDLPGLSPAVEHK